MSQSKLTLHPISKTSKCDADSVFLSQFVFRSSNESVNNQPTNQPTKQTVCENTSKTACSKLVITFPPNPAPFIFVLKKPVDEIIVNSAKNDNPTIVYKTLGN